MRGYGQFCPVAKTAEILGDSWSILIVREMLLESTRFNALQKGLPRISPTVLTTRLKELEASGVIVRRRLQGQRGHEYRLTAAGRELAPLVEAAAVWGMRWARDRMDAEDYDVAYLMLDIKRRIDASVLPDGETVLCFRFSDLDEFGRWWLVCSGGATDLCQDDPGKDVDCYVTSTSRDLIGAWMGDVPVRTAIESDAIKIVGDRHIAGAFPKWFTRSAVADVPRPPPGARLAEG